LLVGLIGSAHPGMTAQLEAGSSRADKIRMMVSADGIDGVSKGYSSFVPSRIIDKSLYIIYA
jgi:hypothetical protein